MQLSIRSRYVRTGQARTEYLSGPADTRWLHWVNPRNTWAIQAVGTGMLGPLRTYRPGEHATESWYAPVVRPAIPRGVEGLAHRKGDQLTIGIPEFADTASGHYGYALPRKDADTPTPTRPGPYCVATARSSPKAPGRGASSPRAGTTAATGWTWT